MNATYSAPPITVGEPFQSAARGRHAVPDRVGTVLSTLLLTAGGALLLLLGAVVREPCSCDTSATARAPVAALDLPPAEA